LLLAALVLVACSPPSSVPPTTAAGPAARQPAADELTIFAASSLTDAFEEIGRAFEAANPVTKVAFSFGASSQLRTQLEQGAVADLFASADQVQMDRARGANLLVGVDRVFARNRLVVILPKDNSAQVSKLEDLARPGLKLVTAAPDVPIGAYTQEMLDRMTADPALGPDFKARFNDNVVSREPNVRQVVTKVSLGEADAAVVYSSDVTPDAARTVARLEIPDRFNTLANYPIAVLREAPHAVAAERFVGFLLGPDGQAILSKWGFIAGG
jgi:molybdate transport system substrate-binding protein